MQTTENISPFKKEILLADKQLRKTNEKMGIMKQRLEIGDLNGAYQDALKFAESSELLTLYARQLPAYNINPQMRKMSEQIMENNIPVRIGFTPERWFGIVMPTLLPKKNRGNKNSSYYVCGFLYPAMQNFFRGKQPVKYTDCVMIFRHIYQRDRPERQYRDHDNIEVKAVIDVIALYILFDDSPLRCSHYYCSAPGDENRTEVLVIPQNEFGAWIADAHTYKNKEVLLLENLP